MKSFIFKFHSLNLVVDYSLPNCSLDVVNGPYLSLSDKQAWIEAALTEEALYSLQIEGESLPRDFSFILFSGAGKW